MRTTVVNKLTTKATRTTITAAAALRVLLFSPLLLPTDLMPPFIRHGPTIPRRAEVPLPEPMPATSYQSVGPSDPGPPRATADGPGAAKSFMRPQPPRSAQEAALRASQRLSAPPYGLRGPNELALDYCGSQQSFLTTPGLGPPVEAENGGGDVSGARFYYSDGPPPSAVAPGYYEGRRGPPQGIRRQQQPPPLPPPQPQPPPPPPAQLPPQERFHDDYRYYEHHASEHAFSRMPPHTPPPAQTRPPAGE